MSLAATVAADRSADRSAQPLQALQSPVFPVKPLSQRHRLLKDVENAAYLLVVLSVLRS